MKSSSVSLEPGQKTRGWVEVVRLATGQVLSLPFVGVSGREAGPTVGAVAGVHGDEYEGPMAIWSLWRELEADRIKGAFVGIPHANPFAFQSDSRTNPLDGMNLNRAFPGRKVGTVSEAIAWAIMEQVVARCDFVVDLHSGGRILELLPLVLLGSSKGVEESVEGITRATGLPVVWEAQYPGTLADAAVNRGIPAVTLETGGQGRLDVKALSTMKDAIVSVLRHVGVLHASGRSEEKSQTRVRGNFLKAEQGGFFESLVHLGETVDTGQEVGRLLDGFGEEMFSVSAPHGGLVCSIRTTPPVLSGGELILVGEVIS